jgi:hypothetical protein
VSGRLFVEDSSTPARLWEISPVGRSLLDGGVTDLDSRVERPRRTVDLFFALVRALRGVTEPLNRKA